MSSRAAEIQVLLEGVPLPAGKRELIRYALGENADHAALALLESLPEREYRALDEVGEALEPVQPTRSTRLPEPPRAESGVPPGGEAYTDSSAAPGALRERGPAG